MTQSTRPCCCSRPSTQRPTESSSVTSITSGSKDCGRKLACRLVPYTRKPKTAMRSAQAWPIPDEAPVTSTMEGSAAIVHQLRADLAKDLDCAVRDVVDVLLGKLGVHRKPRKADALGDGWKHEHGGEYSMLPHCLVEAARL